MVVGWNIRILRKQENNVKRKEKYKINGGIICMLLSELKENIYKAEIVDKLEIKTYLPMFTKQLEIGKICGLKWQMKKIPRSHLL